MHALASLLMAIALAGCGGSAATPTPDPEPYPVGSCMWITGPTLMPDVTPNECVLGTWVVDSIENTTRASCPLTSDDSFYVRFGTSDFLGKTYCISRVGQTGPVNPRSVAPSAAPSSAAAPSPTPRRTLSGGLEPYGTDLAFRWSTESEADCLPVRAACWGMVVVSWRPCGDLFVRLAILDEAGVEVDEVIDGAEGVVPGEHSRFTFYSYEDGATTARIRSIDCFT